MNPDGANELLYAVCNQAVKDYKKYLRKGTLPSDDLYAIKFLLGERVIDALNKKFGKQLT